MSIASKYAPMRSILGRIAMSSPKRVGTCDTATYIIVMLLPWLQGTGEEGGRVANGVGGCEAVHTSPPHSATPIQLLPLVGCD